MSAKSVPSSQMRADPKAENSVYDFLYQDARRVGSFLAQLNAPFGHTQTMKEVVVASETETTSGQTSAEGGLPAVAKIAAQVAGKVGSSESTTLERTFDPLWTNALDLLDLLDSRGMIQRDIKRVGVGNFLLFSGEVLILDTSNQKSVFEIPQMNDFLTRSLAQQISATASGGIVMPGEDFSNLTASQKQKKAERDAKFMLKIIMSLPPAIHLRIVDQSGECIFCALRGEGLTVPVTDIGMNHGTALQGRWNVLAIYDARPEAAESVATDVAAKFRLGGKIMLQSANAYGPLLREVGRSSDIHGATPLLIFREVGHPT